MLQNKFSYGKVRDAIDMVAAFHAQMDAFFPRGQGKHPDFKAEQPS